jgi:hypothetical protein
MIAGDDHRSLRRGELEVLHVPAHAKDGARRILLARADAEEETRDLRDTAPYEMPGKLHSARDAEPMVTRLTEPTALTEHASIIVPAGSVGNLSFPPLTGTGFDWSSFRAYTDSSRGKGQPMPTDLGVTVEDRPGGLADIGEALGNAGINIEGLCGVGLGDRGVIHLLVEDGAAARAALEGAGLTVESESQAIVSEISGDAGTPGTMGRMARAVADAGVNMQAVYLATNNRAVAVTDDNDKARAALGM